MYLDKESRKLLFYLTVHLSTLSQDQTRMQKAWAEGGSFIHIRAHARTCFSPCGAENRYTPLFKQIHVYEQVVTARCSETLAHTLILCVSNPHFLFFPTLQLTYAQLQLSVHTTYDVNHAPSTAVVQRWGLHPQSGQIWFSLRRSLQRGSWAGKTLI